MDIVYRTRRLERVCTDYSVAKKTYGERMAVMIHRRIDEMTAAVSIEEMVKTGIGRCHHLSNNRKGQYAVDLVHPYRLIIEESDGMVHIAKIIEITDYH